MTLYLIEWKSEFPLALASVASAAESFRACEDFKVTAMMRSQEGAEM
jgi:hypothetical protein